MPFGPFALQWRPPTPNPPTATPLPPGISRSYISTPSGPLELLTALPLPSSSTSKPALFFAHGGFGCADVWLQYMQYFANRGYPCYAVSYRGHGKSWYPGFWRMYFTSRDTIAGDLVSGIEEVERLEMKRRGGLGDGGEVVEKEKESARVVLIAHSAGGALSQYVLSRGLVKVQGFCMLAAVPGFGSWSCYKFWSLTAPFHFPYRLFHPRYVLATTTQVHQAFFSPSTPTPFVKALERLLSPYESMLWPTQALFGFVTGPDVLKSIVGWGNRNGNRTNTASSSERMLVLAAELDVLCTPQILQDAAERYRAGYRQLVQEHKIEGESKSEVSSSMDDKKDSTSSGDGVVFKVVLGLGHHLQNHVEWEKGAVEILEWVKQL